MIEWNLKKSKRAEPQKNRSKRKSMENNMSKKFDEIRPFRDEEVAGVIESLCKVPYFIGILGKLFPDMPTETIVAKLRSLRSIKEFQSTFILPYLVRLTAKTTNGCTASGIESLDPKKGYVYMTNHRDIILDSALLNSKLYERGWDTTEIAIGSNLLIYEWIEDLVKLNKSFVVKRDLPVRQMMDASATLSAYIRERIVNDHQDIWIAQREGRSKDGNDRTQGSLLKMLNLSGGKDLIDNFKALNIVPVSITYEYDPCDALKAYQYQMKRDNPQYKKSKDEDLKHMSVGLSGQKGRVHFAFGKPINDDLDGLCGMNKNDQITAIADMIDRQIFTNYKIFEDSYISLDMLEGSSRHADKYSAEQRETFCHYLDEKIAALGEGADAEFCRQQMLQAYANPLINQESVAK